MNTVQKSVLDLQFKLINSFKCQSQKMAKHVKTIRWEIADELFEFVWPFCEIGA